MRSQPPDFVLALARQVHKVFASLEQQPGWQEYRCVAQALRDGRNSKRRARAWFLQHQEGAVCRVLVKALQQRGFQLTTVAHDAVYVYDDGTVDDIDVTAVQDEIEQSTGYGVKLRLKDLGDESGLLQNLEVEEDATAEAVREVESKLSVFTVMYPQPLYCVFDGNTVHCTNKSDFVNAHSCVIEPKNLGDYLACNVKCFYKCEQESSSLQRRVAEDLFPGGRKGGYRYGRDKHTANEIILIHEYKLAYLVVRKAGCTTVRKLLKHLFEYTVKNLLYETRSSDF